jgi:hypothetical protein
MIIPFAMTGLPSHITSTGIRRQARQILKLPVGRESEFPDMNQFSGIGVVSLEFRIFPEVGVIA